MEILNKLTYTGTSLAKKSGEIEAYIPSNALKNAVNLTLFLQKRPLLLMGEPGCGKTRLAEAVAHELHNGEHEGYFFEWNIKSTSRAQDGIYSIDHLSRLHDANIKSEQPKDLAISNYIEYHAMYKAFTTPNKKAKGNIIPNILLIDEIDKADIDFPNDLLLELDKRKFDIRELKDQKKGEEKEPSQVIVFITSNQEKELPSAFLRRCLFHFIDFPKEKELEKIVFARFQNEQDDETVKKAVQVFQNVRTQIGEGNNNKRPSTSELLDWYQMLHQCKQWEKEKDNLNEEQKALLAELAFLGTENIPFKEVLLKNEATFHNIKNHAEE